MKLIDIYNECKKDYSDYVVFIKCGVFYESLNDDAAILNKVLNYKIKESKSFNKVGFPLDSLNKVLNELNRLKVNYIVYENEIVLKQKFNKNNYGSYLIKLSNEERIWHIYKTLTVYKTNNMDNLLCRIERML